MTKIMRLIIEVTLFTHFPMSSISKRFCLVLGYVVESKQNDFRGKYLWLNSFSNMSLSFSQCYKSSKDQTPQMELLLSGCSITHIPKDGKKKKHELKIVHQGADALVLAVQSKEQAEEWLKVTKAQLKQC